MKDFKNFVNTDKTKNSESLPQEQTEQPADMPKLSDFKDEDVKMISSLTQKYANNKEKLVSDIVSLAEKNKKEGKLNNKQLEEFEKKISPMLSSKQKKMLEDIMKLIKK
jgi:hypothetical protein